MNTPNDGMTMNKKNPMSAGRPGPVSLSLVRIASAISLSVVACVATGQTTAASSSVMTEASVEELVAKLAGTGADAKAFRPAPLPNSHTNQCPGATGYVESRRPDGGLVRTPVVVSYAGSNVPSVDLAVHFDTGSDRLTGNDRKLLDNLGRALNDPRLLTLKFAVAGHTDAVGDFRTNLSLSCARAIAARDYLLRMGVDGSRLTAYGFGSSRPIDGTRRESAINRRVEIRRGF